MSSRATTTSSLTQMYCCFKRDPQALCSRLNEMARLASVAEKSFTGIETLPNETVSVAIDRAAMPASELVPPFQGVRAAILRLRTLGRTLQALLAGKGVGPAVAGAGQALGGVGDPEVERVRFRKLLPGERHRHRRAGRASGRVGGVERFPANIHVVVHEDLSGPLWDTPLYCDVLRMETHEMPPHHLAHLARGVEVESALDRYENVQPGLARGLHHRFEGHAREQLAEFESDLLALLEGDGVQLGLVARGFLPRVDIGVDVEHDVVGIVQHRGFERGERARVVGAAAGCIRPGLCTR